MTITHRGLLDDADYDLAEVVLESWDAFIALVDHTDLSARTRLDGWTVREVVLHLGTWDGQSALTQVLASLRSGDTRTPLDPDSFNAEVLKLHADATDDEVRAALAESRSAVAELLASDEARDRAGDPVSSVLGPMPLLTVMHAGCYELALHALDIEDATDERCPDVLLRHGIAALADSTGCLAAREGIEAAAGVNADEASWSFATRSDGSWSTRRIEGAAHGPRVSGSARNLLEASAGRVDPVRLVTLRQLKIKHVSGLLALTPIIDQVPGLPGGRGLKVAARTIGGLFR
ncbi:maleylpyruvate isomerase N-terminal domain-containing protein [Aeromicrobium chenweiae]|uniref:Uncharacterized protein n=1 Tax=Aeromicrobium chenweiae TaxID=2079793 RepID=A0A2S0WI46_9ACTN|nr:maleylpyruvate isomerase N-terminal domain-containing protein [Aeromicrobium chenweiae]AWB91011.1 hypothetical protein C3E78_01565 [Aeromicrobium chenweiae]TGN31915.1 maleylpyruvate isomerase family mycothiol-dependent enzyme [Aeromicrobium chenweiae]